MSARLGMHAQRFRKPAHKLYDMCRPALTGKVVQAFQSGSPRLTVLVDPTGIDMDAMLRTASDTIGHHIGYVSDANQIDPALWQSRDDVVMVDVPGGQDDDVVSKLSFVFRRKPYARTVLRTQTPDFAYFLRIKGARLVYDDTGDQSVHPDYVDMACSGLCTDEKTHQQLVELLILSNSTFVCDAVVAAIDQEGEHCWNKNNATKMLESTKQVSEKSGRLYAHMRTILA